MNKTAQPNPVRQLNNMLRIAVADQFGADATSLALDTIIDVFDRFQQECMENNAIPVEEKGRIAMTISGLRKGVASAKTTLARKNANHAPEKPKLFNDRLA